MKALFAEIDSILPEEIYGRVAAVQGLLVEVAGPVHEMSVGSLLEIESGENSPKIPAEVVGFREDRALCMPFSGLEGVRMGCKAIIKSRDSIIHPAQSWLGRVVNAMGQPIDGKGDLENGGVPRKLRNAPPPASERARVGPPLDLGVRALNTFVTCCEGQRMGIFAGSGVGKSVLMSMLARNTQCDVAVIGLIGERGREVQEFIEDDLGESGLERSVIVVATSDESVLMRRQAAYLTMSVAEHFRDLGKNVLCMMDSITRFAMAQREIGLSIGEPPTSKGYTPTVFTELPRLLERAGPGKAGTGSITGLFTVLVEGDNHNEPVADAVRGILDGHIVMERAIAERGRYPAINVLKSVSRTMPRCVPEEHLPVLRQARRLLSTYTDMEELIRLGAYRKGSDPIVDEAISKFDPIEAFLDQRKDEATSLEDGYSALANLLEMTPG
ncbi:flagellum-specific ATP synthase [Roseibium hamelinense]|uniref:Flagellum-specific ATP synthase n=1 Tax=Roseibium hamelinense TaxID=150831 RepID=A0A562SNE6_9HYPH|nr:flagellar protein export ATPase FliI [Roseibium hamelinense]MTI44929.1 flagellar protein export ATPase FliI [Roseibium hamelinense]TWI82190.1 flagellum-specific ATP synthase [Roseibium hamelinense]